MKFDLKIIKDYESWEILELSWFKSIVYVILWGFDITNNLIFGQMIILEDKIIKPLHSVIC